MTGRQGHDSGDSKADGATNEKPKDYYIALRKDGKMTLFWSGISWTVRSFAAKLFTSVPEASSDLTKAGNKHAYLIVPAPDDIRPDRTDVLDETGGG